MGMLFHVYQGKNIFLSGTKPIISEFQWYQAQYITISQVASGKAVQGPGGT